MSDSIPLIRLAEEGDDAFILEQVPHFVDFPLPPWRRRKDCGQGIHDDLLRHLEEQPAHAYLFIAENADGERAGFIHLKRTVDFFTGSNNCHISDLAVAPRHRGTGIGKALLAHAENWAAEHDCSLLTLAVFPGNERARALYAAAGFAPDLLRLAKPVD